MRTRVSYTRGMGYEEIAARFLKRRGYRILARNWRHPGGELDIVTVDADTLVFVEVRARAAGAGYLPEESIDEQKRRRLLATAEAYLASHEWHGPCRFDVVAIDISSTGNLVRLIRDAFGAS